MTVFFFSIYSVICSGWVVFLSWLSYDLSIMMLLVISIRLASVPILGCLVDKFLKFIGYLSLYAVFKVQVYNPFGL